MSLARLLVIAALLAASCIDLGKPYPEREQQNPNQGGGAGSTSLAGADSGGAGGAPSSMGGLGAANSLGGQDSRCDSEVQLPAVATVHEELDSPLRGGHVQASSRRPEVVDVVRLEDGAAYFRQFDGTWSTELPLGRPYVDDEFVDLVSLATTDVGYNFWVLAVGEDSHIYFRSTGNGDQENVFVTGPLGGWSSLSNAIPSLPDVASSSAITVTSWGPLRLDVFWWTTDLELAHAWWDGGSFSAFTETSATVAGLRPPARAQGGRLASAVTDVEGLHVFVAAGSTISHHSYDDGWHDRAWRALDDDCRPLDIDYLDAASRTKDNVELFLSNSEGTWHSWMRAGAWRTNPGSTDELRFGFVSDAAGRVSAGRMISPAFSLFVVGSNPEDVRHQILWGL